MFVCFIILISMDLFLFLDYLRTWMNKIEINGNRAEDWLEFTRHANQTCTFTNNVVKHNYLCNVYEKAFKVKILLK